MKAEELIARMTDLPSISQSATKLMGLLNGGSEHVHEIVECVQYDTMLSANVLRVCNSAYVGAAEPVASVNQAVMLLGFNRIFSLVIAMCFGETLNRPLPGYAIREKELWEHSLATAVIAERIALNNDVGFEPSVAFTGGLLHDIGKVVLNSVLDQDCGLAVCRQIEDEGLSRDNAERQVLEIDHTVLGSTLLRQWRLPEVIIEAVEHHHEPILDPRPGLSAIVHIANCVSHEIGYAPGWHGFSIETHGETLDRLGLNETDYADLFMESLEELDRVKKLLRN